MRLLGISIVLGLLITVGGILLNHYYWSANKVIEMTDDIIMMNEAVIKMKIDMRELNKQLQIKTINQSKKETNPVERTKE